MRATLPPELVDHCWTVLKAHAPKSLSWNHYDLAAETDIDDTEIWKTFLLIPEVAEWLTEEQSLMQKYELAKLTTNVANSRSVGQAQLISAVNKVYQEGKEETASGPAFVYCYIPLNEAQKASPNVRMEQEDLFFALDDNPIKFDDSSTIPT